ncbi:bifunctional [glutamine synthetase] adenylyltransferase/[glutamine synthetase]-adenylyl-L-tyrosine phosphorylase [Naumannella huperziae]
MTRLDSLEGRLARVGFARPDEAAQVVRGWPAPAREVGVDQLARAADPDRALESLARLVDADPGLPARLAGDQDFAARLIALVGASDGAANDLAAGNPASAALVEDPGPRDRAGFEHELTAAVAAAGADPGARAEALRVAYRTAQLRIAARDLVADDPFAVVEPVGRELADLADATVAAALQLARDEVGPEAELVRLGVVALGKTGGRELNYVSDVDVLFVAEPAPDTDGAAAVDTQRALAIGSKIASAVIGICSAHTRVGQIFPLDAALRPEGKAGPLVRTLASHRAYYEKWAKNWEFQAMLKARPMAGDAGLAGAFTEMIAPLVWAAAERPEFLADLRAMRRRVVAEIPPREADREIKLGAGGLRDVEFTVQLLQLVHGRADDRIRARGTLAALAELIEHGYVGRSDGTSLGEAYRFLRALEHRVQLVGLRRTHLTPGDVSGWRRAGRSLGLADPAAEAEKRWRQTRRTVLALHQRMFYSPLLEAVARIPADGLRLTPQAAGQRLKALGYDDPDGALRHIAALTRGLSRKAEINRQLLPAMLAWFAEAPIPDHGLLAFRQVSEDLGDAPWFLRALRDEGMMGHRLATVLASSRYLLGLLQRDPQAVRILGDDADLTPRDRLELNAAMERAVAAKEGAGPRVNAVRSVRRRELFRIGAADVLGRLDSEQVAAALSDLTAATIYNALLVVLEDHPGAPELAIVAMGRWGGRELSYASDADAVVVMRDSGEEATRHAVAVVSELRTLLAAAGPEPGLQIDLDLRPDGKSGPLVRSLAAYQSYYAGRSEPWEAQALIRADTGAGGDELATELLSIMDATRWPAGGLDARALAQIRRLKDRMETERLPRGEEPRRHLKLGPGGLSDVEWTVQLIQLQHAHRVPGLRTPSTLRALAVAEQEKLINPADAAVLREAWTLAGTLRNKIMLVRGKKAEVLPSDTREFAAVADLMGDGTGGASHLEERWYRTSRRARRVTERIFYGDG